jgi:hypothetical protein
MLENVIQFIILKYAVLFIEKAFKEEALLKIPGASIKYDKPGENHDKISHF